MNGNPAVHRRELSLLPYRYNRRLNRGDRIKEGEEKNLACFVITIPQKTKSALFTQKGNALTGEKEKYSLLSYKLSFVDVRNSYEYWRIKAHKHKKRLIFYCFILTRVERGRIKTS